jgi:hypothetical protein
MSIRHTFLAFYRNMPGSHETKATTHRSLQDSHRAAKHTAIVSRVTSAQITPHVIAMRDATDEPLHALLKFAFLVRCHKGCDLAVHSCYALLEVVNQQALCAIGTAQSHFLGIAVEDKVAPFDAVQDALLQGLCHVLPQNIQKGAHEHFTHERLRLS